MIVRRECVRLLIEVEGGCDRLDVDQGQAQVVMRRRV